MKTIQPKFDYADIEQFVDELFGEDMHAKRVQSIASATLGVMRGASLAVSTIGHALAAAEGLNNKHTVKQVDRLLANGALQVWELFAQWVPYVVGSRQQLLVAMDRNNFV